VGTDLHCGHPAGPLAERALARACRPRRIRVLAALTSACNYGPPLLLPLPVSLLYTPSLPPYCCPYPCPYCTLPPSLPSRAPPTPERVGHTSLAAALARAWLLGPAAGPFRGRGVRRVCVYSRDMGRGNSREGGWRVCVYSRDMGRGNSREGGWRARTVGGRGVWEVGGVVLGDLEVRVCGGRAAEWAVRAVCDAVRAPRGSEKKETTTRTEKTERNRRGEEEEAARLHRAIRRRAPRGRAGPAPAAAASGASRPATRSRVVT